MSIPGRDPRQALAGAARHRRWRARSPRTRSSSHRSSGRLVDAKLDQQQSDARILAIDFATSSRAEQLSLGDFVDARLRRQLARRRLRRRRHARAGAPSRARRTLRGADGSEIESDPTALAAATGVRRCARASAAAASEFAEVAFPLLTGGDVMLADALARGSARDGALVKRRLLFADVAALAIAVVLGLAVAALHARRIRRLERAADRIAEGALRRAVADDGHDELGQLAAAFDRMRVQLAQLDRARKEFVANASHELRTPLFSLGGFLELLTTRISTRRPAGVPRHDARARSTG